MPYSEPAGVTVDPTMFFSNALVQNRTYMIALIGNSTDQFGGYFVHCDGSQTVNYTFVTDITGGLSLGFWFRPRNSHKQTLFAIQPFDTQLNHVVTQLNLAVEYELSTDTITLKQGTVFSHSESPAGISESKCYH